MFTSYFCDLWVLFLHLSVLVSFIYECVLKCLVTLDCQFVYENAFLTADYTPPCTGTACSWLGFIERVTSWPSHWGDSPDNRNGRFFSYWDESSNLPPGLEQGGVHLHVDVPAAGQKWRWARGAPHSSACRLSFKSLFSVLLFTPDFGSTGISEYGPFLLNFLYFSEYGCEWWWWKQTWGSSRSTHRLPMLLSLAPGGSPSGTPQGSCRESCFPLLFAQCQYLGCNFFHFINSAAITPFVSLSPKLIEISHLFSFPLLYNFPLLD